MGAKVAAIDVDDERLEGLCSAIGGNIASYTCDIRNSDATRNDCAVAKRNQLIRGWPANCNVLCGP